MLIETTLPPMRIRFKK